MTRPIQEGDKVIVYWAVHGKSETWTEHIQGIVINAPAGTGDSWYIEDEIGQVHMINHHASDFLEMIKVKEQCNGM